MLQRLEKIEQQIKLLKEVLLDWNRKKLFILNVRGLEDATAQARPSERQKGYERLPALYGYEALLDVYQLLNPDLTAVQTDGLRKVKAIMMNLAADFNSSGKDFPSYEKAVSYARRKVIELEEKGEIYLLSGHETHFNITKLTKKPEGFYTYTLYDAGHESEIVRYEGDKMIVHAVSERWITWPYASLEDLIINDVLKRGADPDSLAYQELKQKIEASLEPGYLRAEESVAQRRGNCTTRGQRILMNDILKDPALSLHIHRFITDVDNPVTGDIYKALEKRLITLKIRYEKILRGLDDSDTSIGDILERACQSKNYHRALLPIEGGQKLEVWISKPHSFIPGEVRSIQEALDDQGDVAVYTRGGQAYPDQVYYYVPYRDKTRLMDALKRLHHEEVILPETHHFYARAFFEQISQTESFQTVRKDQDHFLRTVPGLFSDRDLRRLIRTVNQAQSSFEAELQVSKKQAGQASLAIKYDIYKDNPDDIENMIIDAVRPHVASPGVKGAFQTAEGDGAVIVDLLPYIRSSKAARVSAAVPDKLSHS